MNPRGKGSRVAARPFLAAVLVSIVILSSASGVGAQALVEVSGTVCDPAGEAIAGAAVSAAGGPVVRTGASGAYSLEIAPGECELTVSAPGRQSATRKLTVSENASGVDFSLSPSVRISEDVVVSAVRADSQAPVSRTD